MIHEVGLSLLDNLNPARAGHVKQPKWKTNKVFYTMTRRKINLFWGWLTFFDKISYDNNISNYKGARVFDIEGKIRAAPLAGTQLDYQITVHFICLNYLVVSFHPMSFYEGCALFKD